MVQCHVHPKWEYYEPGMEAAAKPMSPHYLLKLKKGGVAALVGDSLVKWARGRSACLSPDRQA